LSFPEKLGVNKKGANQKGVNKKKDIPIISNGIGRG
jgi:hypothetical protein